MPTMDQTAGGTMGQKLGIAVSKKPKCPEPRDTHSWANGPKSHGLCLLLKRVKECDGL